MIIPYMIMDLFRSTPGLPGLFMAALSSASLSTISSCLSAISVIAWYDLFKPWRPNMSEFRGLLIAKASVVVCGGIGCFLAVLISATGSLTLNQITYTLGVIFRTPTVGLFYVGALFPFVNIKGAITGFVAGIVTIGSLVIGSMHSSSGDHTPYYPLGPNDQCPAFNLSTSLVNMTTVSHVIRTTPEYDIFTSPGNITNTKSGEEGIFSLSYTVFSSICLVVVIVVGVCASLLTGGWTNRADPELVIHRADIQIWGPPQTRDDSLGNNKRKTEAEHVLMVESPDQCPVL